MSLDAHLRELHTRHRNLDDRIEQEFKNPSADTLKLYKLKKQKLLLKQQIEGLKTQN